MSKSNNSNEFEFKAIVVIALRKTRSDHRNRIEVAMIIDRLDRKIIRARLASLTTGQDLAGKWTLHQHDSLDHSVIYIHLADSGVARFSMENAAQTKEGTRAMGDLIIKFQDFRSSSWKEVKSLDRPWKPSTIPTLHQSYM